jgi:hypothetical protein
MFRRRAIRKKTINNNTIIYYYWVSCINSRIYKIKKAGNREKGRQHFKAIHI